MNGDDTVRTAYGEMAELYIELFGAVSSMHRDDLALIERHLMPCDGPVLDLGCGPGDLTAHLRSLGVDARGIDLTPEFIDHARATHPDGTYELGSIAHLAAADASVTGAVAWYSLIHTPPDDLDHLLHEAGRVLAPGAPLVVGFFDSDELEPFDHKVTTAWRWPADELAERLAAAGFTELERFRRAGTHEAGKRPHATIAAQKAGSDPG